MTAPFQAELIEVIPVANTLGEGVLWDAIAKRLWWTDIQACQLYRYEPASRRLEGFALPERLGSFGLVKESGDIVAAFESGFALYHPETGRLKWLDRHIHQGAGMRFNDGRVDRAGRFWAGSMVEDAGQSRGRLHCLHGGRGEIHLSGIQISNSLCFSPSGHRLYFSDTPSRCVWRFDMNASDGSLSNRQLFVTTPEGSYPDGANVDSEGRVWLANWGGGCVTCHSVDGEELGRIALPVSQPTCVAFGGSNLDVLYITSARQDLSAEALERQPNAGHVFAYQLNVRGLPEPRYVP